MDENKSKYLARQVESADRDGPTGLETDDDHPDGVVSWIECPADKRSWAEVQEEYTGVTVSFPLPNKVTGSFNRSVMESRFQENISRLETSMFMLKGADRGK